ncbi:sulfite exporter TauE/SafE family protein [Litoribacter ruber]|uniref:sulfite exporter TauE/SafE family protein n=1 Tax=Litoribacter ruber TaxID=702568 RepID=UPI001BDA9411|nr:sulfite exporter TauE/SafE family protein [Litoribacter ruber]MBT0810386.1 sulfite exporter TauE/SafE family protein [Litoribacter ruber]
MLSSDYGILLLVAMPVVAFLYASVGHGGASSYLMFLTLAGFIPDQVRPTALLLNIAVSLIAFISYNKVTTFPHRIFWPLVAFSIPAAYLGGTISIDPNIYKRILGVLLLLPVLRFLNVFPKSQVLKISPSIAIIALIGLGIGLLSGLIGIGGGIILSPLILMLGWADMKVTATLSSIFIFVNSIAGLTGSATGNLMISNDLWLILGVTIIGGIFGAFFGAQRFKVKTVEYLLTTVLLIASVKLIWT